jgi:hypothetical protein
VSRLPCGPPGGTSVCARLRCISAAKARNRRNPVVLAGAATDKKGGPSPRPVHGAPHWLSGTDLTFAEPKVSVLLAVHDGQEYLREAIDSILGQSLSAFELIVVDDGSTDETPEILASYSDGRLILIRQERTGLTRALNVASHYARADCLARMDADDLSHRERLQCQLDFLLSHPTVLACGTDYEVIDARGRVLGFSSVPHEAEDIRARLIGFGNCIAHGSSMIRRDAFEGVGRYREEFVASQDYDLWLRLSEIGQLANVPRRLYRWRLVPGGVTTRSHDRQLLCSEVAREAASRRRMGLRENLPELFAVAASSSGGKARSQNGRRAMSRMLCSMGVRYLDRGVRDRALRRLSSAVASDPSNLRALGLLVVALLPAGLGIRVRSAFAAVMGTRSTAAASAQRMQGGDGR